MDYEYQTLCQMVQDAGKDLGEVVGWSIRVTDKGTSLVILYNKRRRAWYVPGPEYTREEHCIAL